MKNDDSAVAEREYPESPYFANNFARQFKSYDETIIAYRCGGHIPTRQDFNRAKLFLKTQNKKSATWTD